MKAYTATFLLAICLSNPGRAQEHVNHIETRTLAERYNLEKQRPPTAEPARWNNAIAAEKARSFRWVLIDGIMGDLAQSLYFQTRQILTQELGVRDVQVVRPSSFNSMLENADWIGKELMVLAESSQSPLILVAHSRGAAETFLALLKRPQLLAKNRVAKVILVQGAFYGSPLADFVGNAVDFVGDDWNLFSQDLGDLVKMFGPSLEALKTTSAQIALMDSQKRAKPFQSLFQNKVYFVRAQSELSQVSVPLKPSSIYLKIYYSQNDGVLLTHQQQVPGWGQDLGVLQGDHFNLLGGLDQGGIPQRAFARALVRRVF